jgi:hypothetical protein
VGVQRLAAFDATFANASLNGVAIEMVAVLAAQLADVRVEGLVELRLPFGDLAYEVAGVNGVAGHGLDLGFLGCESAALISATTQTKGKAGSSRRIWAPVRRMGQALCRAPDRPENAPHGHGLGRAGHLSA